jgi:hypothetical protein
MVNRCFPRARQQEIFAGSIALFALPAQRLFLFMRLISLANLSWHGRCNRIGSRPGLGEPGAAD